MSSRAPLCRISECAFTEELARLHLLRARACHKSTMTGRWLWSRKSLTANSGSVVRPCFDLEFRRSGMRHHCPDRTFQKKRVGTGAAQRGLELCAHRAACHARLGRCPFRKHHRHAGPSAAPGARSLRSSPADPRLKRVEFQLGWPVKPSATLRFDAATISRLGSRGISPGTLREKTDMDRLETKLPLSPEARLASGKLAPC